MSSEKPSTSIGCFAFIGELPGSHVASVRTPSRGLGGWLTRTQERLARKALPDAVALSHVRGNLIAVDNTLNALLQHSSLTDYSFFVEPTKYEIFKKWADVMSGSRTTTIHTLAEVLRPGLDVLRPDIWLSFIGNSLQALRCRHLHSSRIFPTVGLLHGIADMYQPSGDALQLMLTPSYGCDSLICTSRACQKAMKNILEELSDSFSAEFGATMQFDGRLDLIPLCINTDIFQPNDKAPLRKQLGIPKESIVLLYVGYISLIKADFLPIFPMIKNIISANPGVNIQLIMAGTGPETYGYYLQNVISEMGLEEHVIQYRSISDTTKRQLYAAADIFLAPCDSIEESFGLAPVEAMACGLPQVVADWDGYRDTVCHGETGFLVPTHWGRCDKDLSGTRNALGLVYDYTALAQTVCLDISSMHDYLQALIRNPDLRAKMSKQSRARALAEFSYSSVVRKYEELFCELIAISKSTKLTSRGKRFNQARYFDLFGHFASKELTDECAISAAENSLQRIAFLIKGVDPTITGIAPFIVESLLVALLHTASTLGDIKRGIPVGLLLDDISSDAWPRHMVRRHLLFLIKHGACSINETTNM